MKNISILGCGWLGFPLAKKMIDKGFGVNGSTTSSEKIGILEAAGIKPFLISLGADGIHGEIGAFLSQSDILLIDIPPKLRGPVPENFVAKIEKLLPHIEKSGIKKLIFISSTSVYADKNLVVTEATKAIPETESGKQLLEAETLLQNHAHFKTTVLRFGGLVGNDRDPVKFLAGKENLENPDAPINLIHQDDCIGIIVRIIEKDCWGEIFNAAAPFHPSRADYYAAKAEELQLPIPQFNNNPSFGKTIDSGKIAKVLGYDFVWKRDF